MPPPLWFLRIMAKLKELSIFIDESGDFGDYDPKSPFYIIGMVLHDQQNDISSEVVRLDNALKMTPLQRNFVHVGPLIRREEEYGKMSPEERLSILRRMVKFAQKTDFHNEAFVVEKKHIGEDTELVH